MKRILKPKWATEVLEYFKPVPIISSAIFSSPDLHGGRSLPVVILDSSDRPDLDELIRVHEHLPPGDVVIHWGQRTDSTECISLRLEFSKPSESLIFLEFNISKFGALVDLIFSSRILLIMGGRLGHDFLSRINDIKLTVEIPDTNFFKIWDDMLFKSIVKKLRKNGLGRQEAKNVARQKIENGRKNIKSLSFLDMRRGP